jgi:leucyl aminopeptidase (aminopeptidase T)
MVLKVHNYEYKVIQGPKKIVDKMNHEKKEVMSKIKDMEKSRSLPKSITDMYHRCFNYIGEFAVNLNPKAKICNYLIVNEKIAKMMHVAMGSGFEPDRKTLYHWDMVINAPRQKMDVFGVDKKGHEHWIIKKGEFVV